MKTLRRTMIRRMRKRAKKSLKMKWTRTSLPERNRESLVVVPPMAMKPEIKPRESNN